MLISHVLRQTPLARPPAQTLNQRVVAVKVATALAAVPPTVRILTEKSCPRSVSTTSHGTAMLGWPSVNPSDADLPAASPGGTFLC